MSRARAADTNFELTDGNAEAVAAICARLDGLPLAIELAAARTRMFPPQAILERLNDAAGGSLTLLSGGGGESRYQTLRSAIDWSYRLLDGGSQKLLSRVSVFRGGWSFEAAEAVCGDEDSDVFAGTNKLLDASLIQQEADSNGRERYQMLDTIREFADAQLLQGDRGMLEERHASYFLVWAEAIDAREGTANEKSEALKRLAADDDNAQKAIAYLLRSLRRAEASRLAGRMAALWLTKSDLSLAASKLTSVLGAAEADLPSDATSLYLAGHVAFIRQELHACLNLSERAIHAAGSDAGTLSDALRIKGNALLWLGQESEAKSLYEQARLAAREYGDKLRESLAAENLVIMRMDSDDLDLTVGVLKEASRLQVEMGERRSAANAMANVGVALYYLGRPAESRSAFLEAAELAERGGSRDIRLWALAAAADCSGGCVTPQSAREELTEAYDLLVETGARRHLFLIVDHAAELMRATSRYRECATLRGAADAVWAATGQTMGRRQAESHDERVERDKQLMPEDTWHKGWDSGQAMTIDEVISYVGRCLEPDAAGSNSGA